MIRVETTFVTEDGLRWETRQEAEKQELYLELKTALMNYQDGMPVRMTVDDFMQFIEMNKYSILKYLGEQEL